MIVTEVGKDFSEVLLDKISFVSATILTMDVAINKTHDDEV